MSALALVLARGGAVVRGSDQTSGTNTALLEAQGVQVCLGHSADNLHPSFDRVVVSAAINADNPELLHAQRRGCKVYKYAQMLGEVFNRCRGIAISGTHGKSTTSAWLTYVLQQARVDVDFVIGASTDQLVRPPGAGPPDYFIAEACEYDRSFLSLRPHIACMLNIEPDHLDYYRDEAEIVSAFAEFAAGIEEGGVLVAHGQDANVMQVITQLHPRPRNVTIGLDPSCDVFADHIVDERGLHRFDVYRSGQRVGSTRIGLPATQLRVANSLAAADGRLNHPGVLALWQMAERLGMAVILVMHTNKRMTTNAKYKAANSSAWINACRMAWLIAEDPNDPHRRSMTNAKNNLAYDITGLSFGFDRATGSLRWDAEPLNMTANQILAEQADRVTAPQLREAVEFLQATLADGPMAPKEIKERAGQEGISEITLNRAKKPAGVESVKDAYSGGWHWRIVPR
ncbi:MAG: hypothetical protein IIA64_12130 [Planctomycetes bacterium]|nr:hypothetical protein [Planctomycetota bacterium]